MTKQIKILFHYSQFNIGGAERSTLRLMNKLLEKNWEVTLVLNVGNGSLEEYLDTRIKVVRFFSKNWKSSVVNQKKLYQKLLYFLYYSIPILFYTLLSFFRKLLFQFRSYDAAIISLQGLDPSFVCKFVKSRKKYLYIRNDLSKITKRSVYENIKKYGNCLDGFLCVSKTALESLDSINTDFKKKAQVLYNIIDFENIKEEALANKNPYDSYIKKNIPILLTVSRMSNISKAIYRQIDVATELKKNGFEFHWFFIGDGPDLDEFKRRVSQNGLDSCIISLGEKSNPYPYIKNADIVCVLSYYEGLSGVINEAKTLGLPVIATQFSGVDEQLINERNGIIVDNNFEAIIEGMSRLLGSEQLRLSLKNNYLGSGIDNNETKIKKLESIITE